MRREIAKLLETGQELLLEFEYIVPYEAMLGVISQVEHIKGKENMMLLRRSLSCLRAYCRPASGHRDSKIEDYIYKGKVTESLGECPLDLKEAISSVCFAAPKCADLPELLQVQILFTAKYGKEFVLAATELRPDCGVNRQLIELLSIRAPSPEIKLKILKEIAEEHELEWDPASTESEFFKPREDLLNGPTQFVTESKLPLPAEKHDETLTSAADHAETEQPDSDSDFDLVDFPDVPNVSLPSSTNAASAPVTNPPSSAAPELEINNSPKHSRASATAKENKQFLPFISPPSISARPSDPTSAISKPKSETNFDLEDILAAAQSAAESAEHAAAAARSAANLAQVRIAELKQKRNGQDGEDSSENHLHTNIPHQPASKENPNFDHLNWSSYPGDVYNYPDSDVGRQDEEHKGSEAADLPSLSKLKVGLDSPVYRDDAIEQDQHQKHRRDCLQ
ncbi:Transducin family protein / WD-40 repeat family protein isoform 1 [Hibiscus syriacus]|uniref:Transducin family protein / WD-40 repeat family protein isoform 1 n=1 Tax=Hibiscus syriacus TaxID=106335 RepID=A0A6A3AD99_HIBSY|nr:Transducin family protein / WD-40 repeat family protein isoform 1 [Hibiscus syriacus]